jgi:hypothetical protein
VVDFAKLLADENAAKTLHEKVGHFLQGEVTKLPSAYSRAQFFRLLKESAEKNIPNETQTPSRQDMDAEEAISLVDEIRETADYVCDEGREFADSVLEKSMAIGQSVERIGRATQGQITALENMLEGLQAWVHD